LKIQDLMLGVLTLEPHPQSFFTLVIFQMESHIFARDWPKTMILPTSEFPPSPPSHSPSSSSTSSFSFLVLGFHRGPYPCSARCCFLQTFHQHFFLHCYLFSICIKYFQKLFMFWDKLYLWPTESISPLQRKVEAILPPPYPIYANIWTSQDLSQISVTQKP
jgi:hypothetical protein